jgi:lipid-binding SYLF domain-containing protein
MKILPGRQWLCLAALWVAVMPGAAMAQTDQEKLVAAAEKTFDNFVRDPSMTWIQQNIGSAKGVVIAPEILRLGFILGGSGGRAVLLSPDPKTGKWSGPAFYTLVTGSIGFQAGVEVSEVVMLVMTDKGFNSLLGGSFKFGGDIGVAAGPVGAGAKSSILADFVTYSRAKGIYGGLNLDGASVSSNVDWNQSYYKQPASATDILVRHTTANPGAAKLLEAVAGAAAKK